MTDVSTGSGAGVRGRWGLPRFGYRANVFMLWVGSRFLWLAYFFVYCAAGYFLVCSPKARRASVLFMERVRGRRGLWRRNVETYLHMAEFGKLLLDRAIMLTTARHGFGISCEGLPNLRAALDMNKGVMLLTAHFGSAETTAPYMEKMGLTRPVHIVMYQQAGDSTERFHTRHRALLRNMEIISTTEPLGAGLKIIAALKKGDTVAMRADRTLDGKTVGAEFLGSRVHFPAGPFLAAALTDAPVVHTYTVRTGRRAYVCVLGTGRCYGEASGGTREERVGRAAQEFADSLAEQVRKYPRQWGNFFDLWGEQG